MATCKDCIHLEACVYLINVIGYNVSKDQNREGAEKRCSAFSDKSRFLELPCKIGQSAWMIRNYKGERHPQLGEILEMYFTPQMELVIAVKYVGRGIYGKNVFLCKEDAEAALAERIGE